MSLALVTGLFRFSLRLTGAAAILYRESMESPSLPARDPPGSIIAALLALEWRPGTRLRRHELLRRVYAGALVFLFFQLWTTNPKGFAGPFLELYVGLQFVLICLLTPLFGAGTMTEEKARGTLSLLLTTSLTSGEIIAYKFLARVGELARLALVGLPLLCFAAAVGGLHLWELAALATATFLPLFPLGAIALAVSVECRSTRNAVLTLYGFGLVIYLLGYCWNWFSRWLPWDLDAWLDPLAESIRALTPLYVAEPIWRTQLRDALEGRLALATAAWIIVGAVGLLLATRRLRYDCIRELGGAGRRSTGTGRAPTRPPVGERPIFWKERYVGVLAVWGRSTFLAWLGPGVVAAVTVLFLKSFSVISIEAFLFLVLLTLLLVAGCVSVRAAESIVSERERQTLESLLLTPLPGREIVEDKHRAITRAVRPCLFAWGVAAFSLTNQGEEALMVAIGVVLAWGLTDYLAAMGIVCSARLRGSWHSLMATLGFGLLGFCMGCVPSAFMKVIYALIPRRRFDLGFEMLVLTLASLFSLFLCKAVVRPLLDRAAQEIEHSERTGEETHVTSASRGHHPSESPPAGR